MEFARPVRTEALIFIVLARELQEEEERLAEREKYGQDIEEISTTVARMADQVASLIQENNKLPEKDRCLMPPISLN